MLRQEREGIAEDATADRERSADLTWPIGISRRVFARDAACLAFFLGAIGLDYPVVGGIEFYVWSIADFVALVAFALWPASFLAFARRNVLLLIWPLLAITSTLWSVAPDFTIYRGTQLLMTVLVGVLVAMHMSLFRVIQIFFVASTISAVLSLIFVFVSPSTTVWLSGEWQGLFRHKNMLGNGMAFLIFTGVCLFLQGWRPKFTAAATALGAGMLLMSRSGAGTVAAIVAVSPIVAIFVYRQGYTVFVFSIGVLLSGLAAGLLYVDATGVDVVHAVLDSLGKDSTLTGRTVLWEFGMQAFEDRPWLGFGYQAWWVANETAANMLRLVVGQQLFTFHSTYLEAAVAFGIWGPIALAAAVLFVLAVSVREFLTDPQYIKAWPLLYIVLLLVQATAEQVLMNNHGLAEVLLVVIGSAGMRRIARGDDRATHSDEVGYPPLSQAGGAAWR